nr:hypothetical protein [Tatlockia sp.]
MLLFKQIFKDEQVKKFISHKHFLNFLVQINPFIDHRIDLDKISLCPWDDYHKQFHDSIITSLNNSSIISDARQGNNITLLPKIKGVYFCLGDDGLYFSIHGSQYFNETDWAANADFDFDDGNREGNLLQLLSYELATALKLDPKSIVNSPPEPITDLTYLFSAFTILKTMENIKDNPYLANAGIAMGYSDGDELIFGHFSNGTFIKNIQIIPNGDYKSPSTAPEIVLPPTEPRGAVWEYLRDYYLNFIKDQDLMDQFVRYGEKEAERICKTFEEHLVINRCPLCQSPKKTPRARLCLNCGIFTDPCK